MLLCFLQACPFRMQIRKMSSLYAHGVAINILVAWRVFAHVWVDVMVYIDSIV